MKLANMKIEVLLIAGAAWCASGVALAQSRFDPVQSQMRSLVGSGAAPSLTAAAIEDGVVSWMHAEGWADVEARVAATPDTIYRVGSVSKAITATVFAIAERDGLIRHSTCVRQNCAARASDAINMNANLAQAVFYPGIDGRVNTLTERRFIQDHVVSFGDEAALYDYSNVGPALVAQRIESRARLPFADYASSRLLEPLSMHATHFAMADASRALRAASYRPDRSRLEHEYETWPYAGAGLVASVRDLTRFAQLHLDSIADAPVSADEIARLHRAGPHSWYGWGWGRLSAGERTFLVSDGQVNGGQAIIVLDPARRSGVVVAANAATSAVIDVALSTLEIIHPGDREALMRGSAAAEAASQPPAPVRDAASWTGSGVIRTPDGALSIEVSASGEHLTIELPGGETVTAQADGADGRFLRWSLSCFSALPACRLAEATAVASIRLVRDDEFFTGVIAVSGWRGEFPYRLRIRVAE